MNIEEFSPKTGRVIKEDGTIVNIADLLEQIAESGIGVATGVETTIVNITVLSTDWADTKCIILNDKIKDDSVIYLAPPTGITAVDYDIVAIAKLTEYTIAAGSLTIQALGTVPTTDITVTMIII